MFRRDPVSESTIRDLEDRMGDKYDEIARLDHKVHKLTFENQALKTRIEQVEEESKRALAAAEELVADWKSAMEAWKSLAIYLKEEADNCPNAEAHPLGKNRENCNAVLTQKDNESRVKYGLKPIKNYN